MNMIFLHFHTVVCDYTFSDTPNITQTYFSCLKRLPVNETVEWTFTGGEKRITRVTIFTSGCLCCYHDISAGDCSKTTSHRPLVNALMHGLQKRWPHTITCTGSFSTFLQAGQVRVSNSAGFRGPFLLYTVVLLMSYPCAFALVAIL